MLRPRLFLPAIALTLACLPRPGWPAAGGAGTLDQLAARVKALEERAYEGDVPEEEIRNLESEFISLFRRDPENRAVAKGLASFYEDWQWKLKAPDPALLDLV